VTSVAVSRDARLYTYIHVYVRFTPRAPLRVRGRVRGRGRGRVQTQVDLATRGYIRKSIYTCIHLNTYIYIHTCMYYPPPHKGDVGRRLSRRAASRCPPG